MKQRTKHLLFWAWAWCVITVIVKCQLIEGEFKFQKDAQVLSFLKNLKKEILRRTKPDKKTVRTWRGSKTVRTPKEPIPLSVQIISEPAVMPQNKNNGNTD